MCRGPKACMRQASEDAGACAPLAYFAGTVCWPPMHMRRNKTRPAVPPPGEACAEDRFGGGPWYSGNVRKRLYDRYRSRCDICISLYRIGVTPM